MDQERFFPFYEAVAKSGDKMIQVHPCRDSSWSDYKTEERSKFEIWWTLGWEYDLSAFMSRLVFSGVFERLPDIKILIHHGGAMIPHFAGRVGPGWDQLGARTPADQAEDIEGYPLTFARSSTSRSSTSTRPTSAPATRCARPSSSSASITPCSAPTPRSIPKKGPGYIRDTIANLQEMDILDDDDRERSIRQRHLPAGLETRDSTAGDAAHLPVRTHS